MIISYLLVSIVFYIYLLMEVRNVDFFEDGEEIENKIIMGFAAFFISISWIISLPIFCFNNLNEREN